MGLLHDLVLKLKATERLVANTLWEKIQSCMNLSEKARLQAYQQEQSRCLGEPDGPGSLPRRAAIEDEEPKKNLPR